MPRWTVTLTYDVGSNAAALSEIEPVTVFNSTNRVIDMGFNVSCTPGRDAAAAFMRLAPELPALVLYLDPVNMAIQLPTLPDGARVLAKFCRELAREAARLAEELDPLDSDEAPQSGPGIDPAEKPTDLAGPATERPEPDEG